MTDLKSKLLNCNPAFHFLIPFVVAILCAVFLEGIEFVIGLGIYALGILRAALYHHKEGGKT